MLVYWHYIHIQVALFVATWALLLLRFLRRGTPNKPYMFTVAVLSCVGTHEKLLETMNELSYKQFVFVLQPTVQNAQQADLVTRRAERQLTRPSVRTASPRAILKLVSCTFQRLARLGNVLYAKEESAWDYGSLKCATAQHVHALIVTT